MISVNVLNAIKSTAFGALPPEVPRRHLPFTLSFPSFFPGEYYAKALNPPFFLIPLLLSYISVTGTLLLADASWVLETELLKYTLLPQTLTGRHPNRGTLVTNRSPEILANLSLLSLPPSPPSIFCHLHRGIICIH